MKQVSTATAPAHKAGNKLQVVTAVAGAQHAQSRTHNSELRQPHSNCAASQPHKRCCTPCSLGVQDSGTAASCMGSWGMPQHSPCKTSNKPQVSAKQMCHLHACSRGHTYKVRAQIYHLANPPLQVSTRAHQSTEPADGPPISVCPCWALYTRCNFSGTALQRHGPNRSVREGPSTARAAMCMPPQQALPSTIDQGENSAPCAVLAGTRAALQAPRRPVL